MLALLIEDSLSVCARACTCVSVRVCEAAAVQLLVVPASDSTPPMRQPLWPRIAALVVVIPPPGTHDHEAHVSPVISTYPEFTSPSYTRQLSVVCSHLILCTYLCSVCDVCHDFVIHVERHAVSTCACRSYFLLEAALHKKVSLCALSL